MYPGVRVKAKSAEIGPSPLYDLHPGGRIKTKTMNTVRLVWVFKQAIVRKYEFRHGAKICGGTAALWGCDLMLRLRFPTVTQRHTKERGTRRSAGRGARQSETQGVRTTTIKARRRHGRKA